MPFPTVAHLLRPAQGGMRELVRVLLEAAPADAPPLLLAPDDTLAELAPALPDASRRAVLKLDSFAPHHQLAAGQLAARFAKKNGANLLHGHGLRYAPLFAAASVASGLPLVVTLHNLVPDDLTGLHKAAAQAALSRASAIIAVSEAVAKTARAALGAERLVTIPNGIDAARFAVPFAAKRQTRTALRERLHLPPTALLIVCVARLSPEKDVANLLEAFALCHSELLPDTRLLIAGDGKARQTLQWHADLLGIADKVSFLGALPRPEITDLLLGADVFALASREEGLSLAVLEAMAAGLPVVATAVGGLPEAVAEGVTGWLVPSRDPATLGKMLAFFARNETAREKMGDAGRNRVAERFTQERMIRETFAVYSRVADR